MNEQNEFTMTQQQRSRKIVDFYPAPVTKLMPQYSVEVFSATYSQERWERHRHAADLSYAKRGLGKVGRNHAIIHKNFPTFFAEATLGETIIGGVCIYLPDSQDRLPLLEWLEGTVDTELLAYYINKLSSKGIVQCGGLWTDSKQQYPRAAGDLARSFLPMIAALKVRFSIITCPKHTLEPWCSLGSELIPGFSDFHYPDERYQSYIILNDTHRWKYDLARWAFEQSEGKTLEGPELRFKIRAMRTENELPWCVNEEGEN